MLQKGVDSTNWIGSSCKDSNFAKLALRKGFCLVKKSDGDDRVKLWDLGEDEAYACPFFVWPHADPLFGLRSVKNIKESTKQNTKYRVVYSTVHYL